MLSHSTTIAKYEIVGNFEFAAAVILVVLFRGTKIPRAVPRLFESKQGIPRTGTSH
jgi:hypothetical protein